LPVPVISLGAGNKGHGVHIITSDLFKLWEEHVPRHSKVYTDLIPIMEDVFIRYRDEVREHIYPGPEHTVYMSDEDVAQFAKDMKWESKLAELDKKKSK
jgi:3-methyl-2-oxobutanoate hydroxymethyltransferase